MGCIESEEHTFFYMSIPLDEEHAAKAHIFLPRKKSDWADGVDVSN
jgi:hypothetical protein